MTFGLVQRVEVALQPKQTFALIRKCVLYPGLVVDGGSDVRGTFSYETPTTPNAPEVSPLQFYTRLFGPEFQDPNAASFADRVIFLADGRIVDEMADPTAERVLDRMKRFGE